MKNILKGFILASAVTALLNAEAQKIDSALHILATQYPSEKIYIHYDKEYYVAGETIWFKAYLYSDGKPGSSSTNLYLQFAESKGRIIINKRYPSIGAVAKGTIDIPDSLPGGNYTIRAFTAGMLNEDEAFIYKKNVFVFNPADQKENKDTRKQPPLLSLQFFPESGNLVDGILTVMAFKATDEWGSPADVSGVIKTEDGITIASFKSYHDGIGRMQFKPQAGKKYVAEVETGTGIKLYPLPIVESSGINIKIQDEKGGKKFQLSRSEKDKSQLDNLLLVAEINNHIVYENEITFEEYPTVIGHLVTGSLPSGILHFTVFNKDGMPLAERLSFVDNGEYQGIGDVFVTQKGVEKRAENIFEINFPDTIQRSCSVSVTNSTETGLNDEDNIWSRVLLTSDLKGYIYNPAWYFVSGESPGFNQNDSIRQALDNLMLTHGWSRFNWNKILSGEFPAKNNTDTYLINISGTVYSEKDEKPVEAGKLNVLFSTEDSSLLSYNIPVNENGQFLIDSLVIFGKTKLYYTYADKTGKQKPVSIKTDDNILQLDTRGAISGSIEKYPAIQPIDSKRTDIVRRYEFANNGNPDAKLLENAIVTAKPMRPTDIVNEKYTSGLFRTGGSIKIDNINYPSADKAMNGVDFILNRISTVMIQNGHFINQKNFSIQDNVTIKPPVKRFFEPALFWEVGLFINEMPADISQLKTLRADQIAMVKFFEAGFVGAGQAYPGGLVAVYLNDETGLAKKEDKSKYIEYNGYSISKEFYSPDYSVPSTNNNRIDNRSTLYWNPEIFKENMAKTVQLKFFNNDFSKKFKIVVEGFDSYGRLIHLEKIIGD